jgi:HD-GYP domain-containing protein (c-di-GMP phosphodiesterase class II)
VGSDPLASLAEAARILPAVPSGRVLAAVWSLEGERSAFRALKTTSLRLTSIRDAFDAMSLLDEVLDEALQLVDAERGVLAVLENDRMRVLLSRMRSGTEEVRISNSLLERVLQTGQAVVTTNVQDDPKFTPTASIEALSIRSVLAVPLFVRDRVIGVLYVDTQFMQRSFSESDASMLATFAAQAGTAVSLARSIRDEHEQYLRLVKTMLSTLDARDPYTAGHSERVGLYTRRLARALGWSETDQERALFAGWVHDIGKIGIRDTYLYKAGKLEPEERRAVEEHTIIGERILQSATRGFEEIMPAVRHHHERWDGQGYPDGLFKSDIPLLARMVGISDAFDAMTTTRLYAPRRNQIEAFAALEREAGKQFDPELIPVFINALQNGLETLVDEPPITFQAEPDPIDGEHGDWSKKIQFDSAPLEPEPVLEIEPRA